MFHDDDDDEEAIIITSVSATQEMSYVLKGNDVDYMHDII